MFIQTWKKYLPVIVFLMKRPSRGAQTLDMNFIDFERATGGKKIKLNFGSITVSNGRINSDIKHPDLISNLILVLQENKPAEILMQYQQFDFSMNTNCQLVITNSTELVGNSYQNV